MKIAGGVEASDAWAANLFDETEESASFYVRHENQRLCAYRVDSPHRLRLHIQPGDILPMDQPAIARALKAFAKWPDDTSGAQIDLPIYSSGATDPHTAALAIPVFGANLWLVGALALSGPVTRLTPDRAQEIKAYIHAAAMRLTKSLGGSFETAQARTAAGE